MRVIVIRGKNGTFYNDGHNYDPCDKSTGRNFRVRALLIETNYSQVGHGTRNIRIWYSTDPVATEDRCYAKTNEADKAGIMEKTRQSISSGEILCR